LIKRQIKEEKELEARNSKLDEITKNLKKYIVLKYQNHKKHHMQKKYIKNIFKWQNRWALILMNLPKNYSGKVRNSS